MAGYKTKLTMIDEMHPWSAIDFRKYAEYIKLRKERDKFLKSLREMTYLDWLIDKKLVEAGGIGKTVYILPARGGGSNVSFRTLEKYFEEGRDVQFVTLKKPKTTLDKTDLVKIKDIVTDWDLCCNREQYATYEELHKQIDEMIAQKLRKDMLEDYVYKQWITSASFDSYIFSPKTYTDWAMRDFLLNPHYGIVYKKDDSYFGGATCP